MASYYYTIIIQDTEPVNPQAGWIWLNESIGQAYIYINTSWIPFAGV